MKNKHLSLEDRYNIEYGLRENLSFKKIGMYLEKNCTTISREIRNHYIVKNTGGIGRKFNNCIYRRTCPNRGKNCNLHNCTEFKEEKCNLLNKPPYVCNGCKNKNFCTLTKHFYNAKYSDEEYNANLSEVRSGVMICQEEINNLNSILTPLICEQGQSINQAILNNKNKIMCCDKTIYKYIDLGLLNIRNIDLPRKVRFRTRTKRTTVYKIDKNCLENRKYEDFEKFIEENPDTPIVEMDSVEGMKGGKVLLTIHFVNCSFMLAYIREHNDAQSVIDIFNNLQETLNIDKFKELFTIILTDNGSEFSNPTEIEFDLDTGEKRTQIFYCHPSSPFEKGSCEVNHELLRRILPKGTSFDNLNQDDINLIMSHINSYKRKKLNNVSPYTMFSTIYGKETADKLGIKEIEPNNVNLSKNLIKR
jgi:IS30 family transposase